MTSDTFSFETAYIDLFYEEVSTMSITLDDDPIRYGPKRVNGKVAATKRLVSRCTEIEISLCRDLTNLNRKLRAATADLELSLQHLLTSDPEVRAGRSVKDREAIASMKLRDENVLVRVVEQACEEVKSAIIVVKTQKADLKDTQGRIRDQIRLIGEEIALGAMWGSATPDSDAKPVRSNQGPASSKSGSLVEEVVGDPDDLSGILAALDSEDGDEADEADETVGREGMDDPLDEADEADEDELGTMIGGAATDEQSDEALEALEAAPSNGGGKGNVPAVIGLNDDDLEGLLSEEW